MRFRTTMATDRSAGAEVERRHHDDDGDELQDDAPAHQQLRAVARSAAHHVDQSEHQHEGDRAERDGHEIVEYAVHRSMPETTVVASARRRPGPSCRASL